MSIIVDSKKVAGLGAAGKSAYTQAVEGGYKGTEQEFNLILTNTALKTDLEKYFNKPLEKTTNASLCITNGFWLTGTDTNGLPGEGNSGVLQVVSDVPKAGIQIYYSNAGINEGKVFVRKFRDSKPVGDWKTLATEEDIKKEIPVKPILLKNIQIPAASWTDSTKYIDYPFEYKIPVEGITDKDYAQVTFDLVSSTLGILAPINETVAGGVMVYSFTRPDQVIVVSSLVVNKE